jgi:hypothetical protein
MGKPIFNPEQAAANALDSLGMAAIWELHLAAARAYRKGNKPAAWLIADIADAAERVWLRRKAASRG